MTSTATTPGQGTMTAHDLITAMTNAPTEAAAMAAARLVRTRATLMEAADLLYAEAEGRAGDRLRTLIVHAARS